MLFSDRMVPEVYQRLWAAMARGEFITDAAAEAGTYRRKGAGWLRRVACGHGGVVILKDVVAGTAAQQRRAGSLPGLRRGWCLLWPLPTLGTTEIPTTDSIRHAYARGMALEVRLSGPSSIIRDGVPVLR